MRKYTSIFCLIALTGCTLFSGLKKAKTDNQDKLDKQQSRINQTLEYIKYNQGDKVYHASLFAAGVGYSLNQITNPPVEVITAQRLNDRVVSIVGTPYVDDLAKIQQIVNFLNSEIESERSRGEKLLREKDATIAEIQAHADTLQRKYDQAIKDFSAVAGENAKDADQNQALINSLGGRLGLNAVFWGLKKFILSSLTIIIVCFVLFFILRLLSNTNPIFATLFSIFDLFGSFVVNAIKGITPKAFDLAKLTPTTVVNKYKNLLYAIIDTVQLYKEKQKEHPDRKYTLQEMLDALRSELSPEEKNLIDDILVELKWKKR